MATIEVIPSPDTDATVRRPRLALWATSAICSFLAFISIVGSLMFSFTLGTVAGYLGGVVLILGGIGLAFCGVALHRGGRGVYRLAVGLAAAELAWCSYKVFIYGETESTLFFVLAVALAALLALPSVRRFALRSGS